MSFSETISPFLGRVMLSWFFGAGVLNIIDNWAYLSRELSDKHVPLPPLALVIALVLMVLGVISLFFGYHTRHGAVLLFGLTIIATVILHDFWHIAEPVARMADFEIFSRDVAICGGLLLLVGMGGGPFSLDNRPPPGAKGKRR